MSQKLLRIEAPHYVAGAIFKKVNDDWRCVKAAPIIKWMIGKSIKDISDYLSKKKFGWKHQWV